MITRNEEFENQVKNYLNKVDLEKLNVKETGLLLTAVSKLYQANDDTVYKKFVEEAMNQIVDEEGNIAKLSDNKTLDQFLLGNVLFFSYKMQKKATDNVENKYKAAILALEKELSGYPRNEHGIFISDEMDTDKKVNLSDTFASQVFYMNYESQFGGKEHYNDIIAQFNQIHADLYEKCSNNEEKAMYLCALIDTMEVMEQPLYEIYHRLQDMLKEGIKGILSVLTPENLYASYAILKACRMKAVITEKYEEYGELAINSLFEDSGIAEKMDKDNQFAAKAIMAYAESIRNRAYQDYGRNKGGILWN